MFKELNKEMIKKSAKPIEAAKTRIQKPVEQKKAVLVQNTLQRPRSKTLIRAIKDLDVLSDSDAEVRKRLREIAQSGQAKNTMSPTESGKTDAEAKAPDVQPVPEIGTDEFERQKQALLDSIRSTISMTMQHMPDELIGILANCGLEGCYTHLIDEKGYILKHYVNGEPLPGRLKTGYSEMKKHGQVSHVEVYAYHICIIDNYGQSKTISI